MSSEQKLIGVLEHFKEMQEINLRRAHIGLHPNDLGRYEELTRSISAALEDSEVVRMILRLYDLVSQDGGY